MKNWLIISILAIILNGCINTIDKDLGNKYYLEISDGYSTAILDSNNTVMIPSEVLKYAFDSTFIIASQRPLDSIPDIKTLNYKEANKAFEESTFRQYWIVNKQEPNVYSLDTLFQLAKYSNVYGPFKKEEYMQKRKELGVPPELKLKE
jgi:hypothetical protein